MVIDIAPIILITLAGGGEGMLRFKIVLPVSIILPATALKLRGRGGEGREVTAG
jgi:hypothetical protein